MEFVLLIVIAILLVVAIILIIVFRHKAGNEMPALQNKIDGVQLSLSKIEASIKDDFRTNREENANIARDNRSELNNTLKDFKFELSQTLKNITEQSQSALRDMNKTLAEKVDMLVSKIDDNNKTNRETLSANLKDFTLEQRAKFDELKSEQKELTSSNVNQLEKITAKVEERLNILNELSKAENRQMREVLVNAFKEFQESFDRSVRSFNEFQKVKFEQLDSTQNELTSNTVDQLEKITLKVEERLSVLNELSKAENKQMREVLANSVREFQESFDRNVRSFNELQNEKFGQLESKQNELVTNTESKLESIRVTVEEKLEKTLSDRLGQSFETVGKQLIEVQKGLGEMQTLAQDVGGLKKVLSNVKMRGGIGEVQLGMLLEQILAPEQYAANVKTKSSSNELVEFAIKLPGKDENNAQVWLPIDAKFPKDVYEQLQTAYDLADITNIELAQRNLENAIKKMAKDIHNKYIDPPNTTDFGIMFLPFEGIYAEVVRKASLLEELQRTYKIVVTGPTTLAAILNSLQMGFKTLAIQQRSSEVWKILGAVKREFEIFGGLMQKAQNNIQTGLNQLDDVMGKRTRAIQRKLRSVELLDEIEAKLILNEIDVAEDENEN